MSSATNFWTAGLDQVKDPKRNFRFKVSFLGTEPNSGGPLMQGGIWFAKSCTQPSLTFTESSVDFMMHKFYWPAKATWNEVDIVLVDPVVPHATGKLLQIISSSGFKIPTSDSFTSVSKTGVSSNLGNVQIDQLDAEGNMNHQWNLIHAWIKEVSFSNLDYGNEELMEITLKLRYDWAEFRSAGGLDDDIGSTGLFTLTTPTE